MKNMRRLNVFILVSLMILVAVPAWAAASTSQNGEGSDPFQDYVDTSRNRLFVVETDESSARSSLDRISGDIDRGFASEEYTYKSRNHGLNGPLENQKDETLYY